MEKHLYLAQESELLENIQRTLPSASSAIIFAPHPDDEVFGAGGLLTLLAEQGCTTQTIILTDGARGGDNSNGKLATTREAESTAAAELLGLPAPTFWREQDRTLACNETLIQRIIDAARESHADLLLLPSPLEIHPDHQALALAGIEALRRLGAPVHAVFYEINTPLPIPNLLVDITNVMSRKQGAMAVFVSQLKEQPYDQRITGLNHFRSYFMGGSVTAAEAFFMIAAENVDASLPFLFEGALSCRRRQGFPVDTSDLPLISVIIRSMDRPTLDEALRSVALQTYSNCEVIVANAKGKTHRPLGNSCGRFPMYIAHAGRALQRSEAANLGLKHAHGDLLIFLDDDDYFLPPHLQRLAERLAKTPKAPAAYSAIRAIDDTGMEKMVFAREFDATSLLADNYIPIHAVLFRRYVIEAGIHFDVNLDLYEDWDFWLQVARLGNFVFEPEIGAVYRISSQEHSGAWTNPERCQSAALSIHRKHFPGINEPTRESLLDYSRKKYLVDLLEARCRAAVLPGNTLPEFIDAALSRLDHEALTRANLNQTIQVQSQEITYHTGRIAEQEQRIAERINEIGEILASTSWRCTAPLRWVKGQITKTC